MALDPLLSQQIALAIQGTLFNPSGISAVVEAQGVPMPMIPFKPAHRKLICMVGNWTTAASPVSKQLRTNTAGKVFRATLIYFARGDDTGPLVLRDGVADGGAQIFHTSGAQTAPLVFHPDYAPIFKQGIRTDAADLSGSKVMRITVMGWEEDAATAEVQNNELIS